MTGNVSLKSLSKPARHRNVLRIKRRRNRAIKSNVSIHDRTQLETFFTYSLNNKSSHVGSQRPSYRVDAYLFFPPQIGIEPSTYPRERFYNDLHAFVRLREPKLSYKELFGKTKSPFRDLLPINYIRDYLKQAQAGSSFTPPSAAIEEARVFACSFVSYFWKRVDRRKRRLNHLISMLSDDPQQEDDCRHAVEEFLSSARSFLAKSYKVLKEWRSLYVDLDALPKNYLQALKFEIHIVNEYCSYNFRDGIMSLLYQTEQLSRIHEGKRLNQFVHKSKAILRLERWYARQARFFWIDTSSSVVEREEFVHRRSVLKKRVSSVLYLNPRPQALFRLQKHVGAMMAAGIAASWALFASLFIWTQSEFNGFKFLAALSGPSVFLIALGFVISYILKDRIKEVGRNLFARGLIGSQPDLVNQIIYETANGKNLSIGKMSEYMHYLKPKKIPEDIKKLRTKHLDPFLELEAIDETVIHYAKVIKLRSDALQSLHKPTRAVHDIIRLSVESYLPRLDDPMHKGYILAKAGGVLETLMPKVYHVDLILKYSPLKNSAKTTSVVYDYFRLVLDKHGLTRIEPLNKI